MKSNVLKVVFCCALIGCVVSAVAVFILMSGYQKSEKSYETLRHSVTSGNRNNASADRGAVNFEELLRINSDTVGWINGAGGKIDYPVVQGNNNRFYLKHLFNKETGSAGCIFLDSRNAADFSDKSSVIYGHNMRVGTMFGALDNYRKPKYYKQHPIMRLSTPDKEYVINIVAGFTAGGDESTYKIPVGSNIETSEYIRWAQTRSQFKSSSEVTAADHLVTFVTCAYDYSDARFILVGAYKQSTTKK